MKEIRYSAKIQEQQTLSDAKGVGPDIDKLKDKFKEGSIPLQTDFNQLIDIADIGRKATGQAPNQNGPAKGMRLGEDGLLQLKLSENDESYVDGRHSPLILYKDVLVVGVGNGLMTYQGAHEIGVAPGDGLKIDGDKVAVKLADNKGLVVDSNGIAIKPGNGMKFSSDGALEAKPADSTITVDSSGIKVNIGSGLKRGDNYLYVSLRKSGALEFDENSNIYVKTGNGIKLDNDQVVIDPNTVLPRGMIMMFSGKDIPVGWALCDGNNGTPNLIDRFILGGKLNDINSKNNATLSGSGSNKKCNKSSDDKVVSVDIKVNDTKLTLSQIPSHKHVGGMAYYGSTGFKYDSYNPGGESRQLDNQDQVYDFKSLSNGGTRDLFASARSSPCYPYTSSEGDGAGHSHGANAIVKSHNHITDVTPPYYILAFIMKL
ncbi:tail fiber protein [Xenorhabdus siamensis]|uniref:tail fiber protein n=1 Tax=Xenorhabdus siamensis TaxID=3136254 RepID=UPI0030F447A8